MTSWKQTRRSCSKLDSVRDRVASQSQNRAVEESVTFVESRPWRPSYCKETTLSSAEVASIRALESRKAGAPRLYLSSAAIWEIGVA